MALGVSGALAMLAPQPPAIAAEPTALAAKIDALVAKLAPAESHVGVSIVAMGTGEVLYEHEAQKLFVPASLQKLATAGAAVGMLGVQRRFHTKLMSEAVVEGGTLRGPLFLKGEGDPMLEVADLDALAQAVKAQGVREVAGDLVGDATAFAPEGRGAAGWAWDDLPFGYGAAVSALSCHRNALTVTVTPGARAGDHVRMGLSPVTAYINVRGQAMTTNGDEGGALGLGLDRGTAGAWSEVLAVKGGLPFGAGQAIEHLSVAEPARFTVAAMREALGRAGIMVTGQLRLGGTPGQCRVLASHASPPLADIVHEMLKDSDNFLAETVLMQVGLKAKGAPATWEKGLGTLRTYVEHAGWAPGGFRIADGSGLSRYNAVSPAMMTRLLVHLPTQRQSYPAFLIGLPVAGVDGTLSRRLTQVGPRGRLRAKTGTMSGVSGLAGYLETIEGRTMAVAIMTNGFVGTADRSRNLQDAVVGALVTP